VKIKVVCGNRGKQRHRVIAGVRVDCSVCGSS